MCVLLLLPLTDGAASDPSELHNRTFLSPLVPLSPGHSERERERESRAPFIFNCWIATTKARMSSDTRQKIKSFEAEAAKNKQVSMERQRQRAKFDARLSKFQNNGEQQQQQQQEK